jgi:plasmid stabilization system protein ParE
LKWQVFVRPDADLDARQAREWYESQRVGLGEQFLLALAEVFLKLEESPMRFPVYYRDFRRVMMAPFPYKVFYRVDGDVVAVVRILHAARRHEWELR